MRQRIRDSLRPRPARYAVDEGGGQRITVAFMLTIMKEAVDLVRNARESAGLSIRALAARAGVAYSTVARIEAGDVDPTVEMLRRILTAAGDDLEISAHRTAGPRIADLADAWSRDAEGHDWPDWTRLRAFLDHIALHPELTAPATVPAPEPSGSPVMDTLLAAIAEKMCDDAGIARPTWTRRIAPLQEAWSAPATPRMRAVAREATPAQLAARGLVVSRDSLWRSPSTAGV